MATEPKTSTRDRNRDKLLQYLGNPENDWPDRTSMALKVLGYKSTASLYKMFTLAELQDIEREGLDIRRGKYSNLLARVDKSLIEAAIAGDPRAAKLVYQRFENWSEKQNVELSGPNGASLAPPIINVNFIKTENRQLEPGESEIVELPVLERVADD